MDLSNQYMKLDEKNKGQDYTIYKILDTSSSNVYEIYYLKKNKNYYYHDDDNLDLSYQTIFRKFDTVNDVLSFISTYQEIQNDSDDKTMYVSRNIYNLGRKKQSIKFQLEHGKLFENFKKLKISDISSDVPKELLSTPNQIFNMIYYQLDKINKNHSYNHYYKPINDSLYNLEMNLFNDKLGQFKFEVKLDEGAFPLIPPKISLIEPWLDRKVALQINNLPDLSIDSWNPTVGLEYLLLKYAEKIINLKDYINKSSNIDIQFEKLNTELAELCGIKPDDIVDFKLDFSKISLKEKKASKYWNAGTGYGHDGITKWDINGFYKRRVNINKKKNSCLENIKIYLKDNKEKFLSYFDSSIIKKYIFNFLNSINILDYSKNPDIYINTIGIVKVIVENNALVFTNNQLELIENFFENIKNLWQKDNCDDEQMGLIFHLIEGFINDIKVEDIVKLDINDDIKEKYCTMVKKYQFGESDISEYYHYKKKTSNPSRKSMIRIMSENSSLKNSLPINWDTSILMRINKTNINYASFFVVGPEGTPYHNGIFEFHMYYPNDYPASNPLVNLMTTGNGTVRFNPNLYNCGKVCLSLLGTWRGQEGESWNPKISTALQVLISIQSLIFIPDPYFNEPGWERDRGTSIGDAKSKKYNELRRLETIRWAINDKIENPVKGIEDFTKEHFMMKQEELLNITQKWVDDASSKYKSQMKEERNRMIELFDKIIS